MPICLKPEAAPAALSRYGVQPWYEVLNYPVMDGSGSRLTNIGLARNRPPGSTFPGQGVIENYTSGAEESGTWTTGSEGARLVLGTGQRVNVWSAGASEVVFKRLSLAMNFTSTINKNDSLQHVFFQSSSLPTSQGRIIFSKNTANDIMLRARGVSGNMDAIWPGASVDLTQPCQLLFRKGRRGMKAVLNGIEGTYSGGFNSYTGPLKIHAGETFRINWGTNPGEVVLDGFSLNVNTWADVEMDEYVADKWINLRPDPANCPLAHAFEINRVEATQYAVCVPAHWNTLSRPLRVQLVQGATAAALAAASAAAATVDTWSTSTPGDSRILYSVGNAAGTRLKFHIKEQGDDGQYRPIAGGFQEVQLKRALAPRIAAGFEDHVAGREPNSGALPTIAFGTDITMTTAADPTENTSANRLVKALHDATYALYTRYNGKFDFWVHIGDGEWPELDTGGGTAATSDAMRQRSVTWRNLLFRVFKSCGMSVLCRGNHDGDTAIFNIWGVGTSALRKQSLSMRGWLSAAPDATLSGIVDPGTIGETVPKLWNDSPTRFRSGMSIKTRDIITASGDDLRAYELVLGSGVLAAEPVWQKGIGQQTVAQAADGSNLIFYCRARWDSVVAAAFRPPDTGNQTWYAFDWGGHAFFIADSERCSLIGVEDTNVGSGPGEYGLGPTQKSAIVRFGLYYGSMPKYLFLHRLPGGKNYRAATEGWYGRIAGRDAADPAYWVARGLATPPDQLFLVYACQSLGIIIVKGHCHHFCIAREVRSGVVIVTLPTVSASSHSEPTFGSGQPNRSWRTALHRDDYGTAESQGLLDNSGASLPGAVVMYNCMGFVDMVCGAGTCTLSLVRTSPPVKEKNSAGYCTRIRKDVDQADSGPVAVSAFSATVSNADASTPDPLWVAMVLPSASRAAAQMAGIVTEADAETQCDATHRLNLYVGDANDVINWSVGMTPGVGQKVVPNTWGGLFAVATAVVGAAGAVEPAWPSTVGLTVVDGGVTWQMVPAMEDGWNDFSATLGLDSSASGNVYVDWGPAVLYQSADLWTLQAQVKNDLSGRLSLSGAAARAALLPEPSARRRMRLDELAASGVGTVTVWEDETALLEVAVNGNCKNLKQLELCSAPGAMLYVESSASTLQVSARYRVEGMA